MVMQYLCLFYGSDNNQYRNYCVLQEDYSDPLPENHLKSARPPCRSFCVQVGESRGSCLLLHVSAVCICLTAVVLCDQVATVCANDPTFIQTCNRIACPPTAAECTPGTSTPPDPPRQVRFPYWYDRSTDPILGGQSVTGNLGCEVPYHRTPYNAAAPAHYSVPASLLFFYTIIMSFVLARTV